VPRLNAPPPCTRTPALALAAATHSPLSFPLLGFSNRRNRVRKPFLWLMLTSAPPSLQHPCCASLGGGPIPQGRDFLCSLPDPCKAELGSPVSRPHPQQELCWRSTVCSVGSPSPTKCAAVTGRTSSLAAAALRSTVWRAVPRGGDALLGALLVSTESWRDAEVQTPLSVCAPGVGTHHEQRQCLDREEP